MRADSRFGWLEITAAGVFLSVFILSVLSRDERFTLVVGVLAIAGVGLIVELARRRWRKPPEGRRCPHCGYDLTGLGPAGFCPECGESYTPPPEL